MLYKGAEKIAKIKRGDVVIGKIRHGKELVYQSKKIYTITYIWDGHVVEEKVAEGKSVLNPTSFIPTKTNRTFAGWNTVDNAKTALTELVANRNITLYAVWIGVPFYLPLNTSGWDWVTQSGSFQSHSLSVSTGLVARAEGRWPTTATAYGYYYLDVDTHGCTKVDVGYDRDSDIDSYLDLGGTKIAGYGASTSKNVSIGSTPTQRLRIYFPIPYGRSGTKYFQILNIYFHN